MKRPSLSLFMSSRSKLWIFTRRNSTLLSVVAIRSLFGTSVRESRFSKEKIIRKSLPMSSWFLKVQGTSRLHSTTTWRFSSQIPTKWPTNRKCKEASLLSTRHQTPNVSLWVLKGERSSLSRESLKLRTKLHNKNCKSKTKSHNGWKRTNKRSSPTMISTFTEVFTISRHHMMWNSIGFKIRSWDSWTTTWRNSSTKGKPFHNIL